MPTRELPVGLDPVVHAGCSGGLIARKGARVSDLWASTAGRFRQDQAIQPHSKLLGDRVHGVRGSVRLEMRRTDEQSSGLSIGLQVEPSDEPVAEQEGKD